MLNKVARPEQFGICLFSSLHSIVFNQFFNIFRHFSTMTDINDLLPFFDIISSLSGDAFYDFVKEFVGADEAEILKIQQIKNTRISLRVPDVFSFFAIKSHAIKDLKEGVCFANEDMQFSVKAGIRSNIELFIDSLKKHQELKSSIIVLILLFTVTHVFIK